MDAPWKFCPKKKITAPNKKSYIYDPLKKLKIQRNPRWNFILFFKKKEHLYLCPLAVLVPVLKLLEKKGASNISVHQHQLTCLHLGLVTWFHRCTNVYLFILYFSFYFSSVISITCGTKRQWAEEKRNEMKRGRRKKRSKLSALFRFVLLCVITSVALHLCAFFHTHLKVTACLSCRSLRYYYCCLPFATRSFYIISFKSTVSTHTHTIFIHFHF